MLIKLVLPYPNPSAHGFDVPQEKVAESRCGSERSLHVEGEKSECLGAVSSGVATSQEPHETSANACETHTHASNFLADRSSCF